MEASTVPKPKASEKTIALYKKNLKRVLDAGLSLKKPKEVLTWLNTVKSKNKKPFSTATKRNILTAIIYHKNLIKGVEGDYKKQQDEYNKELFSKYNKQGTINPEKTKAKQEGFGQKEYDKLIGETQFKDLTNEYELGENIKYYGYFAGAIVKERLKGDAVLKGTIAKAMNLSYDLGFEKSVATKNRLPIYILYRLFYEYNFRNEIGTLKIVFDDKKPENVKDQNIIFINKKTYEVTIIRTMYKTKDKYGLVETKIQDKNLQIHILALALTIDRQDDPKYPETGDVDESVERKKWTPSRLVQDLDKADGYMGGDDVHYNGAEWDNDVSKLLPNGDLEDITRPVFTMDGWMKYFSNKQQFYLRESKAVNERYYNIVVTKKKSSMFDKSVFTFFKDMPDKTLKDYGFSKTTQVSYSVKQYFPSGPFTYFIPTNDGITPNFMYKRPFIQSDQKIVVRGEYLFGKSLDSSAVGGIVRNAGLKYVNHPVAPTDIVKLSNSKYTDAVKEMLEKSKNRGHSIGTHTLVYVPK